MSSSSRASSRSRWLQRSARAAGAVGRDPSFAGLTALSWTLLIVSKGVIRAVPLRRITAHLGLDRHEAPADSIPRDQLRRVRRVRQAILIAAPLTPTNSNCYPQALTAHALLRLSRLPSTFYYGAAFDAEGSGLDTHVWVRCGPYVVTGAPEHRRYAALAAFGHIPRRSPVAAVPARLDGPALRTPRPPW